MSSSLPHETIVADEDDTPAPLATTTPTAVSHKRPRTGSSLSSSVPTTTTTTPTYNTTRPPELASVDFSQPIAWNKYAPYTATPLPLTPVGTPAPSLSSSSSHSLTFAIHAVSGRARATTMHLAQSDRPLPTPMFMPVGTKGCLKAVTFDEWNSSCHSHTDGQTTVTEGNPTTAGAPDDDDNHLSCPIVLANTYHLAIQPTTELIAELGGLRAFQSVDNQEFTETNNNNNNTKAAAPPRHSYNLLTDSGGFQMVSLVKLSKVTEDGVSFENPYRQGSNDTILLRPEDSIRHQNNIGANIIMALDDVVSSVACNDDRFTEATYRTLRWYDRCYHAHNKRHVQSLFPITQGALDTTPGGLRDQCLAGFRHREVDLNYVTPGYAIGGLAGGESKDAFWRVVDHGCRALPDDKPRYLMGVGYPLDIVVVTALGVDVYDCVYPTRTARFLVALVPGRAPGTLRVSSHACATDERVVQDGCPCQACRMGISRARLHQWGKSKHPIAVELVTQHNLVYMMGLVRAMRQAILKDAYGQFCIDFVLEQYPGGVKRKDGAADGGGVVEKVENKNDNAIENTVAANGNKSPSTKPKNGKKAHDTSVPNWVVEALEAAGITLPTIHTSHGSSNS